METTEVRAIHRYARISDQKAREVTRVITGMPASHALNVLNFTPKKAAVLIGKVLRSAIGDGGVESHRFMDARTCHGEQVLITDPLVLQIEGVVAKLVSRSGERGGRTAICAWRTSRSSSPPCRRRATCGSAPARSRGTASQARPPL